jgi:brefeldin A-inhibited guanine nucleotide-exchange protein
MTFSLCCGFCLLVKFSNEDGENFNSGDNDHIDPELYLNALILSCETKNARLMEISLDAFHYLLEHGQIGEEFSSKNAKNVEVFKDKTPIGLTIETICKCADEFDETVQVQVIKALLTAITSLNCEVHGANLLLSVRACFHINLMSKNPIIKVTAKAALTQMIDVINQRMEINDQRGTIKPVLGKENANEETDGGSPAKKLMMSPGGIDPSTLPMTQSNIAELAAGDMIENIGEADGKIVGGGKIGNNVKEEEGKQSIGTENTNGAVNNSNSQDGGDFVSVYQRDAYLLFRALCKLSMKGLNEDSSAALNDSVMLQNK